MRRVGKIDVDPILEEYSVPIAARDERSSDDRNFIGRVADFVKNGNATILAHTRCPQ